MPHFANANRCESLTVLMDAYKHADKHGDLLSCCHALSEVKFLPQFECFQETHEGLVKSTPTLVHIYKYSKMLLDVDMLGLFSVCTLKGIPIPP